MRCLPACLGSSKHRKCSKSATEIPSGDHTHKSTEQEDFEKPIEPITHSKEKLQEQVDCCVRKKVDFDPYVKTYKEGLFIVDVNDDFAGKNAKKNSKKEKPAKGNESVPNFLRSNGFACPPNHRYKDCLSSDDEYEEKDLEGSFLDQEKDDEKDTDVREESTESLFSLLTDSRKQVCGVEIGENVVNSRITIHKPIIPNQDARGTENLDSRKDYGVNKDEILIQEISSSDSLFSWSIGSRKKISSAEIGEIEVNSPIQGHNLPELESKALRKENITSKKDDVVDKSKILIEEECSDSFFSWSVENTNRVHAPSEAEVNSPIRVHTSSENDPQWIVSNPNSQSRTQNVHSVLKPVENLTQLQPNKPKTIVPPIKHQEKENFNSEKDPTFKLSKRNSKSKFDDIAVDTSLSSWLAMSGMSPKSENSKSVGSYSPSPRSYEDRPILGALTLEDIKTFSASPTPRRLRSCSPDETPIIGTVGSYWSCTRKNNEDLDQSLSC